MQTIKELCDFVRETAYAIHLYLGHGHLEKVYENALAHRLSLSGLDVMPSPIWNCAFSNLFFGAFSTESH